LPTDSPSCNISGGERSNSFRTCSFVSRATTNDDKNKGFIPRADLDQAKYKWVEDERDSLIEQWLPFAAQWFSRDQVVEAPIIMLEEEKEVDDHMIEHRGLLTMIGLCGIAVVASLLMILLTKLLVLTTKLLVLMTKAGAPDFSRKREAKGNGGLPQERSHRNGGNWTTGWA
jgi:hypothetical protein